MDKKINYNGLLFRELRIVTVEESEDSVLTDEGLYALTNNDILKALTLDENLKSLGYCFTPDSFPLLCHSNIDSLFEDIKSYIGDVKAEPMYKGFPNEVMEMDEATFRFHQLLHYMSTYGIEFFTGCEVKEGWLPESTDIKKDKADTFKTELKQIEAISIDERYFKPASTLLSRKIRLTEAGENLVAEAVSHLTPSELEDIDIPFKENVQILFDLGVEQKDLSLLKFACKNTMDAFKCIKNFLNENSWHLRTSQKRIIAKLLDSYENHSFEENLMYSNSRREMIIKVLDHIDYTSYSRNKAHMESVALLKDKKLKSWMSKVEKLIKLGASKEDELMSTLVKRPGMFLRMCVRLLKLDYNKNILRDNLLNIAEELSTQTIVDLLNYDYTEEPHNDELYVAELSDRVAHTIKKNAWIDFHDMLKEVLLKKLRPIDTELKDKKVFFDTQDYDIDHSLILKSEEGGYNRGGMAFKIPEEANKVRFFVYWNDKRRVDIDLHSMFADKDGVLHHVGWNGDFNNLGVVTSGDITHSDAAEYIDFDLNDKDLDYAVAHVSLFSGADTFADIDTCFAGLMGVKDLGQNIKLYDPKSCFISQELLSENRSIDYGVISIKDRYIRYIGSKTKNDYDNIEISPNSIMFSLKEYLEILFEAQNVELTEEKEEADMEVSMAKSQGLSLLDNNFFIDK